MTISLLDGVMSHIDCIASLSMEIRDKFAGKFTDKGSLIEQISSTDRVLISRRQVKVRQESSLKESNT